jgi:hypothetical protein
VGFWTSTTAVRPRLCQMLCDLPREIIFVMANPAGERAVWLEWPLRVELRFLCVALALTGVLLAGCRSADDRARVEDSLRDYLVGGVNPEATGFPWGVGVPRVRRNACTDGHFKVQKGELLSDESGQWRARFPEEVALWSCVVTVGGLAQQATVAVTGSTKVIWVVDLPLDDFLVSQTARTYAGITCKWQGITPDGAAVCQLATGTGFAVAVARRFVSVGSLKTGKRVFVRKQPDQSPGFGPLNDKRVFHSETHRGIVCYWSRTGGGTALCSRADRHGYVAGVSGSGAIVLNEHSKIVFRRNHS